MNEHGNPAFPGAAVVMLIVVLPHRSGTNERLTDGWAEFAPRAVARMAERLAPCLAAGACDVRVVSAR